MRDHFKRPSVQEDRYDLVGKIIAIKLRGLKKRQRLMAEKIIDDVLFEAEMDSLPIHSHPSTHGYLQQYQATYFPRYSPSPSPSSSPNSRTSNVSPSQSQHYIHTAKHAVENSIVSQSTYIPHLTTMPLDVNPTAIKQCSQVEEAPQQLLSRNSNEVQLSIKENTAAIFDYVM